MMNDVNRITYNGIDLREYGLYVSGDKTFNSPEKEYTRVSIPGRSGDLFLFDGRYSNVELTYSSILIKDYERNAANIRNILLSPNGYVRLEDSYHPDEYRMACFTGPLEFDSVYLQAGTTDLTFDCRPERWLKSGEEEILISGQMNIPNETLFDSKPLLKIIGREDVTMGINIGGTRITIVSPGEMVYIDCETMDCYSIQNGEKISQNSKITIDDFPVIKSGGTTASANSCENFWIIPRWYIL